jgi:5-formyltetrahydrofolate cyclo-ligase
MKPCVTVASSASRSVRHLAGMASVLHDSTTVVAAKRGLRRAMDAALKARTSDAVANDSAALCAAIAGAPWFDAAGTVAAFLSMSHEVQTQPLLAVAFAARKAVYVPRVTGGRSTDMALLHLCGDADELAALERDRWGIPTPGPAYAAGPQVGHPRPAWPALPPGAPPLSLVLVPGVAFDATGARLGHGKGYYGACTAELWVPAARWVNRGQHATKRRCVSLARLTTSSVARSRLTLSGCRRLSQGATGGGQGRRQGQAAVCGEWLCSCGCTSSSFCSVTLSQVATQSPLPPSHYPPIALHPASGPVLRLPAGGAGAHPHGGA